ncbi:MAG TPA: enoyl-CoA hydratase-related protein [Gaiellaceae bacterium]|jgi:enoyl-CoA hydratase|nr:enoyl-CoA hydratase-related protein [Gaiellaceae bacterium]
MDGVATIWLDNPPVNAITAEVAAAVTSQLEWIGPETRLVVIRGKGEKAFSAGADLKSITGDGKPPVGIQPLADLIEELPVPVVAAIHGHCLGGGLEVALACDIRIADSSASLAVPEVLLGLIPGGGGTQRLPRLIGPARAAWMMLSGERISAAQAESWGLVEFVVEDLDEGVERVARALVAGSPFAQQELKRLLRVTSVARSDSLELEAFARCVLSDDGREGIAAFLEKRAPAWPAAG